MLCGFCYVGVVNGSVGWGVNNLEIVDWFVHMDRYFYLPFSFIFYEGGEHELFVMRTCYHNEVCA